MVYKGEKGKSTGTVDPMQITLLYGGSKYVTQAEKCNVVESSLIRQPSFAH